MIESHTVPGHEIIHPQEPAPDAWMHYISIGVVCKMKSLKVFEVCIWATYPNPYRRGSRHFRKLGNSESMPCLERGIVAFVGDIPRKRRVLKNSKGPIELAKAVVYLMIGKSRSFR